jgi:transposase
MKSKDIIMASTEELKRLHIIKMLFEKKISQKEAASLLDLSTRQVRSIVTRIKLEGNKAIAHKLRGKPSNRKKSLSLKEKVLNPYRNKYHDFCPTFAAEKLVGLDKIKMGKETLRGWLIEAGLHKKRRKPRPHRLYRERKKTPQSQFQRALDQLGVKIIYANSPQAKGRIERLFETFQDRLVKEF